MLHESTWNFVVRFGSGSPAAAESAGTQSESELLPAGDQSEHADRPVQPSGAAGTRKHRAGEQ